MHEVERVDVVVVGGAAAGLSAALVLGRSRRSVVVLDDGEPRNRASGHVQGFLTRDGTTPEELLRLGRAEVERYGVRIRASRADRLLPRPALPGEPMVDVVLADGSTLAARRVVVATGLHDELPDVPGLAERWGRDVLHCPYCHGWEVRDSAAVVLATAPEDAAKALTVRQWCPDVTLVLHGPEPADLDERLRRRLEACDVRVVTGPVTGLVVEDDVLQGVRTGEGIVVPAATLVVQPRVVARDHLLTALGAETAEGPFGRFVVTDLTGATGIPGVWAAGNVTDPQAQVVVAAAAGYRAALAVDHDLLEEDVDVLVAAQRPHADA